MKFECQESCDGKCCTAGWDKNSCFVFLTRADRRKLNAFLGQPLSSFANYGEFKNTRYSDKKTYAWYIKDSGKACRFLKDGKCSVYEARPTQCRTFPFWPENMNPTKWQKIGEFCPGIGKGETQSIDILHEQVEADAELCSQDK